MLDLVALFESLPAPTDSGGKDARFMTYAIPGYEQHRLGRDVQGHPSILIAIADATGSGHPPPIVLEHLIVQHDVECRILEPGGSPIGMAEARRFTVARCLNADLTSYFLQVGGVLITTIGVAPSREAVSHAVGKLAELFQALKRPPRKSVQGLWAELFLIAQAQNAALLAEAWHVIPEDRYDFNSGDQRIEVKSASGRERKHHFALEQLHPPAGVQVLVMSIFVEHAGAGASLGDLIDQVHTRLSGDPDLALHVDLIVSLTLGSALHRAKEERFDLALARDSLAFFAVEDIPTIDSTLPAGISNVRFVSDLTEVSPIEIAAWRASGGIFSATLKP